MLNARSTQQNAESGSVQRSAFSVQRSAAAHDLPATIDELQRLARALQLKASGEVRTKQGAIEIAWDVRKGGDPRWARASALWDLAIGKGELESSNASR